MVEQTTIRRVIQLISETLLEESRRICVKRNFIVIHCTTEGGSLLHSLRTSLKVKNLVQSSCIYLHLRLYSVTLCSLCHQLKIVSLGGHDGIWKLWVLIELKFHTDRLATFQYLLFFSLAPITLTFITTTIIQTYKNFIWWEPQRVLYFGQRSSEEKTLGATGWTLHVGTL